MKAFIYSSLIASLFAGFSPGAPYSESKWDVGTSQTIIYKWVDQSDDKISYDKVAKVNIDFMTGSDENADYISDIAHNLEPSNTEVKWKIPNVKKDGTIYFIRINSLDKDGKVLQSNWSTRFTISGGSGKPDSDPTTIPSKDKATSTSDKEEPTSTDKDKSSKTTTGKSKPTSTSGTETETATETTATETSTTTKSSKTTTTSKTIPTDPSSDAKSAFAVSGLSLLSAALYALL